LVERIAFQIPKEMDENDIQRVKDQFLNGAKLARKAGFHGVELHAR
jgi:2,4-dienoyl-CoA reductase-like NADH-dependent reductase (Old Yellow Enzyme family)